MPIIKKVETVSTREYEIVRIQLHPHHDPEGTVERPELRELQLQIILWLQDMDIRANVLVPDRYASEIHVRFSDADDMTMFLLRVAQEGKEINFDDMQLLDPKDVNGE
jgi:hypothetical protein